MTSIRPIDWNPFSNDEAIEQAKEWMEETYDDYPENIDAFRRRLHEEEYVQVVLDEPMDLYVMGALIEEEGVGGIEPGAAPADQADRFEAAVIGDPEEERSIHVMAVQEYDSGRVHKHAFSSGDFYEQTITLGRDDTLVDAEPRANPTYDRIRQVGRYLDLEQELDLPRPDDPGTLVEYAERMDDGIEVGVRSFDGSGFLATTIDTGDLSEYAEEDAIREAKRDLRRDKVQQAKRYLRQEGVLD